MRIKIYQIDFNKEGAREFYQSIYFRRPSDKKFVFKCPNEKEFKKFYHQVYEYKLENMTVEEALEEVLRTFNFNRPYDFNGRKVSVSDVVSVDGKKYCCSNIEWIAMT